MADRVDWAVSAHSTSDWVTPFRTSPQLDNSLSLLLRECVSDTGSSLSNDSRPNYARHLLSTSHTVH